MGSSEDWKLNNLESRLTRLASLSPGFGESLIEKVCRMRKVKRKSGSAIESETPCIT